jgi:hypothetical protein
MVARPKQRSTFLKRTKAVEAHGIEPFEDIPILPMLRSMTVFLDEALDFFESGDDALFARGALALFLRLGEVVEFGAQFVQVEVTHSVPHP